MTNPRLVVPIADLVHELTMGRRFGPSVEASRELPAVAARYGEWPAALSEQVRAAAVRLGFADLFVHQTEAVAAVLAGRHVAVATGTASGKSLCYWLPILQQAIESDDATALCLFPTKALAHDQLAALGPWERGLAGLDLHASAYDGDTPTGRRRQARLLARVIATNPDMLHAGILPHHTRWERFFRGLRYVVIDEMHVYRGVFGSHVANVLRRLRRVCRFYGSEPRFVLTSATIANPGELAKGLVGSEVDVVDDDGSPRGRRWLVLYNPPVVDERLQIRRSMLLEADAVARRFLEGGVQTIVFAQSRKSAELLVRYVNDGLAGTFAGRDTAPLVRGYRGGYTATERRSIEAELRSGHLRGVAATNALELGIDVGRLDACVIAGYPGTIASLLQQGGRAGRRTDDSAVVLVAGSSPLDQFIVRHPKYVLGRSPEHARIDPDNLLLLIDHVRCAAFELPFGPEESRLPFGDHESQRTFCTRDSLLPTDAYGGQPTAGDHETRPSSPPAPTAAQGGEFDAAAAQGRAQPPSTGDLLAVLEAEGTVRPAGGTWYWLADGYPADRVGLRNGGPTAVTIVVSRNAGPSDGDVDSGKVDVLGTVERPAAATFVHPGAVYLHDGQTYEVTSLDWDAGRAHVVPVEPAVYTRANTRVDLKATRVDATRSAGRTDVFHGELEVTARTTGYRRIRLRTHETVGWGEVNLPAQTFGAGGYWFTLNDEAVACLEALGRWQPDEPGFRGPNWADMRDRARERDGRRCRICNAPEREGRSHDVHHIRPFAEFGWRRDENDAYVAANDLDNLITLCPSCHRVAERALGMQGGLSGVSYALRHIVPLHLMCDARDVDVSSAVHAPWSGRPTVAVYERVAGGVGFGPTLFHLHEVVLASCGDLIRGCPCAIGCPSCVGPAGENGPDAKAHALAVLGALSV